MSNVNDSASSVDRSKVDVGVKSVLYAIKAAMKSTLAVIIGVVNYSDEGTRVQMLHILRRYKNMCKESHELKPQKLPFLDDWKTLGHHAVESFKKLEDVYASVQNHMDKLESVEKLYEKRRTKKMIQGSQCSANAQKKHTLKVKSDARSKSGREKKGPLLKWHKCMNSARASLGINCAKFPKKGTPLYDEAKRLMDSKAFV